MIDEFALFLIIWFILGLLGLVFFIITWLYDTTLQGDINVTIPLLILWIVIILFGGFSLISGIAVYLFAVTPDIEWKTYWTISKKEKE